MSWIENDDILNFDKGALKVYVSALVALANSDGMSLIERDYINLQAALVGIDPTDLLDEPSIEKNELEALPSVLKNILLRDAIALAHIDNDCTDNERTELFRLADMMDVSHATVDSIEDWLLEYWNLLARGSKLFSLEGNT